LRLFDLATLAVGGVLLWQWLFHRPGRRVRHAAPAVTEEAPAPGAAEGDTVRIHYVGRLADGSVFDSSEGEPPLEFTIGAGQVISGMERSVLGMDAGEVRHAVVPPEEAYGPVEEKRILEIDRARLPAGELEVGMLMEIPGSPVLVQVAELRGDRVLVDINHPLAGKALHFEITLLEIERG
jgi:peptidylprolyl isomerase